MKNQSKIESLPFHSKKVPAFTPFTALLFVTGFAVTGRCYHHTPLCSLPGPGPGPGIGPELNPQSKIRNPSAVAELAEGTGIRCAFRSVLGHGWGVFFVSSGSQVGRVFLFEF